MKRTGTVLLILIALAFSGVAVFGETPISVNVNGESVVMKEPPVIINGRTLVPLRAIFEALGVSPSWDGSTRTVSASNGTVNMSLIIGENTAIVNGKSIQLEVPGTLVNGSTMVPARFVAETLGANVDWNAETQTVLIKSGNAPVATVPILNPTEVVEGGTPVTVTTFAILKKTDTTINFGWNSIEGSKSIMLEQSIDRIKWQNAFLSSTEMAQVINLNPSTKYFFRLKIEGGASEGFSNVVEVIPNSKTEIVSNVIPQAPGMTQGFDCTDTTITLASNPLLEFSIDNGITWQESPLFTGLKPSTSYSFISRYKATATTKASYSTNGGTSITTDDARTNLSQAPEGPKKPEGVNSTSTSITLVEDPRMEYSIDNGDTWQESPVFDNLSPSTTYNFVQRYKATSTTPASLQSNGVTDITTSAN